MEGVSKLGGIHFTNRTEAQAENLRKMFLAMASDIRVVLVKLADRLHNMRTLGALRPGNSSALPLKPATSTHHWPTGLAGLSGAGRSGLQGAEPEDFRSISQQVASKRSDREERLGSPFSCCAIDWRIQGSMSAR